MNDSTQPGPSSVDSNAVRGDGLSRRKLVRAGLASTPVLLGLKSESALATGTAGSVVCKPSMWSSVKAANCKLSRQSIARQGTCKDYNHWAGSSFDNDTVCKRKFHQNAGFTKDYFIKDFSLSTTRSDKALKDVCKSNWTSGNGAVMDELSRNCAAIYLNIAKGIACPINEATCKDMWTKCKGGGTWTVPGTNVQWRASDCNEYLGYVCGKTLPSAC